MPRTPEFIEVSEPVETPRPWHGDIWITAARAKTRYGGTEETWDGILNKDNNAIDMGIDNPRTRIGAPFAEDYNPFDSLHPEDDKTGISKMAAVTITEGRAALQEIGLIGENGKTLNKDIVNPRRVTPVFGSGYGPSALAVDIENVRREKGAGRIPINLALGMFPEQPNSRFAMAVGIKGKKPVNNVGACAAAGMSVDYGIDVIRQGWSDVVVVNGSETVVGTHTELVNGSFGSLRKAMSQRNHEPKAASRPFDALRDGFVPADGHATLVLERADFAQARGARPLAKMNRTMSSIDGFRITEADDEEVANTLRAMLYVPELNKIVMPDAIFAHATSTPLGDITEIEAYLKVFGDALKDYGIPITAIKSKINHSLGPSGLINIVMAVLAIRDGKIPRIGNLENIQADPKDPSNRLFDNLRFVQEKVIYMKPRRILVLASGFGGNNGTGLVEAV